MRYKLIIAATLALALCGCGEDPSPADPAGETTTASESTASGVVPRIVGVGVALDAQGEYPRITFVVPDGEADRSNKIEANDEIFAVVTQGVRHEGRGMTLESATALIRGPAGTPLTLELSRDGTPFSVDLVRNVVPIQNFKFSDTLVGTNIRDLSFTEFGSGRAGTMSEFKGKVLVIDVWATWCAPCQKPMDKMQHYLSANPGWEDKVVLIGASIDKDYASAIEHAQKRGWTETMNIHLAEPAIEKLDILAVPLLVVAKPDGTISYYGDVHSVVIPELVDTLLEEG